MAWKGKVVSKRSDAAQFVLTVQWFDDVNPTEVLYREELAFGPASTRDEMVGQIKAVGARQRTVLEGLAQADSRLNVGDEVVI